MSLTLSEARDEIISCERRLRMAQATLAEEYPTPWRLLLGLAIDRAIHLAGWSLKEFAAAVDRDERQCARWINGTERPQFDTMFEVERLRQPLVIALAEMIGKSVTVDTVITIRRSA